MYLSGKSFVDIFFGSYYLSPIKFGMFVDRKKIIWVNRKKNFRDILERLFSVFQFFQLSFFSFFSFSPQKIWDFQQQEIWNPYFWHDLSWDVDLFVQFWAPNSK